MKISELKRVLPFLRKARVVPLILGHHGIGKSAGVFQYTQEEGIGFIDQRFSLLEPGDILGLADLSEGKTNFLPPSWLPTEGRGVLFLDEINRARKDVLNAIFQLVLDRKIGGYTLPPGWDVVTAANPPGDDYSGTIEMDAALLSRFCCIKLTPSQDETLGYLKTKAAPNCSYYAFLKENGLTNTEKDFALSDFVKPDNRAEEAYLRILACSSELGSELLNELGYGIVGVHRTTAYNNWLKSQDKALSFEDMKRGDFTARVKKAVEAQRVDWIAASSAAISEEAKDVPKEAFTKEVIASINEYFVHIPKDAAVSFGRKILETSAGARDTLGEDKTFIKNIRALKIKAAKAEEKEAA